ncbi:MAG: WD40 repeat domain-containing protein [Chloroflexi bacterium]|nr:WD40 repeat domain-containing protein [Chloroflexota bacterium]
MAAFKNKGACAVAAILICVLLFPRLSFAQDPLGQRNTLNLWDAADGSLLQSIETEAYIWRALLSSDGTVIAALHDNGVATVYDAQSGETLHTHTFTAPGADVRYTSIGPGFSPEQLFVIQDNQLWLWDYAADEILLVGGTPQQIAEIAPGPDGQRFLVTTQQGPALIIDTASGESQAVIDPLPRAWDIRWSPDGARIAVAHDEGFSVFDSAAGASLLDVVDDRFSDVYSRVAWSPDGATVLALASPSLHFEDSEIFVFDGETLEQRLTIPLDDATFSLDWTPDSSRFLSASYVSDGVAVYDAQTGEEVGRYSSGSSLDGFLHASWNADASLIVARGNSRAGGNAYFVWEAATGRNIHAQTTPGLLLFEAWNRLQTRVAFSTWPTSTVDVIDLTQPDAPRLTLTHEDTLQGMAWTASGSRLLTWTGADRG